MHQRQLQLQKPFAACAQVQRLAAGDSASMALLWDVAKLLRRDAEPKEEALEAAPGAIVVATPNGDAAGMADGETARVGDADVEPDAADAAVTGAPQEVVTAQPAVFPRLAQVCSQSACTSSVTVALTWCKALRAQPW